MTAVMCVLFLIRASYSDQAWLAFTITRIIAPICIVTKHLVNWNFFSILNKIQTACKFICIQYNEFSAEIFKFVTFCNRFQDHSLPSGKVILDRGRLIFFIHKSKMLAKIYMKTWIGFWLSSIIVFMKNCFWRRFLTEPIRDPKTEENGEILHSNTEEELRRPILLWNA